MKKKFFVFSSQKIFWDYQIRTIVSISAQTKYQFSGVSLFEKRFRQLNIPRSLIKLTISSFLINFVTYPKAVTVTHKIISLSI